MTKKRARIRIASLPFIIVLFVSKKEITKLSNCHTVENVFNGTTALSLFSARSLTHLDEKKKFKALQREMGFVFCSSCEAIGQSTALHKVPTRSDQSELYVEDTLKRATVCTQMDSSQRHPTDSSATMK